MRAWFERALRRIVGAAGVRPQARGARAEAAAARYLRGRGSRLIASNVHCRGGEIDLIVDDRGTIAFVEVRLRSHASHGGAAASITPAKRRRIVRAARHWLATDGGAYRHRNLRFDALLFEPGGFDRPTWLKAAFDTG